MAVKLRRPELLDPVRRNLDALAYLLHADGEVVTEISRRQDQYTRGSLSGYWFPLTWLAVTDQNRRFAAMARQAADGARLSALLEYPELSPPLPPSEPLPDDFEKPFPELGIVRVRRGPLSATVILGGSSRLMTLRSGGAVLEGVRFATSFFGKGQFIPDQAEPRGGRYMMRQTLEAPYYQPLGGQSPPTRGPQRGASGGRARSRTSNSRRRSRRPRKASTCGSFPPARGAYRSQSKSDFVKAGRWRAARLFRTTRGPTCSSEATACTALAGAKSDSDRAQPRTATFSFEAPSRGYPVSAST